MTTIPATGAGQTPAQTQTPSAATTAGAQLAGNFDTFLTLLTTQLKNQDPLSPLDTNQFTQQLVSFAGVEQSIQTNQNLESLLGIQRSSQAANAVSYIGRSVTATTNQAALSDGEARWDYSLAIPADKTALVVTDANNKVVAVASGETGAGAHSFTWNGKDSSGASLPDGLYTLSVSAVDAAGQTIPVNQTVTGPVDAIDTSVAGGPQLSVGGVPVGLDAVVGVRSASDS
jgi:flagellar basal-body rod modification protein FlgD